MKTFLTTLLTVVFVMACGTAQDAATNKSSTTDTASSTTSTTSTTGSQAGLNTGDYFTVEGYVSPINISVNSVVYRDSEDFYTQELRRLQADVKVKYPGYKLSFDASVGLRNFKNGMYVFLVSSGDVGVASESYVDSTGKFIFTLDGKTDRKVMYTLRATKRISMKLVKDKDIIQWCYNMFAEKEIPLDSKSAILRQFATVVTEYQCSDPANGLQLPDATNFTPEQEQSIAKDQAERDRMAEIEKAAAEALKKDTGTSTTGTPTPTPTGSSTPTPAPTGTTSTSTSGN